MLPYLLIMVLLTSKGVTTIQQPLPSQLACTNIEQDIAQQSQNNGAVIISQHCYDTTTGTGY